MAKHSRNRLKNGYNRLKLKIKQLYTTIINHIKENLNIQLLVMIAVVGVIAAIVAGVAIKVSYSMGIGKYSYITYEDSIEMVQSHNLQIINQINQIEKSSLTPNIDGDVVIGILESEDIYTGMSMLYHEIENAYEIENPYSNGYIEGEVIGALLEWSSVESLYQDLLEIKEVDGANVLIEEAIEQFLADENIVPATIKEQYFKTLIEESSWRTYNNVIEQQIYIIDSAGNIKYPEGLVKKVDVAYAIEMSHESQYGRYGEKITSIYPVIIAGEIHYLLNESILRGDIYYAYSNSVKVFGWAIGVLTFIVLTIYLTRAKIRYIEYISYCLSEIAKGDLEVEVEVVGEDEVARLAADIMYMENEIKNQIDERAKAEKVKNELVTNVAHDLRTPLTSIIGYIGLLKDQTNLSEEEQKQYIEVAYNKSEQLKNLIEDLFEYTKLTSDKAQLKKSNVALSNLINQLVEELRPQAVDREIKINTHIEAERTTIEVDVDKIIRVFENLIVNAIKYSPVKSSVDITIKDRGSRLELIIQNRCEHIPKGDINRLFERFYRDDLSRNSKTGGSGLGLAIVKNIITLHGGKIDIALKEDIIIFRLDLPRGRG